MARTVPPPPLRPEEFRERIAYLRAKFPGRDDFDIAEIDPRLGVWLTSNRRFLRWGNAVLTLSVIASALAFLLAWGGGS